MSINYIVYNVCLPDKLHIQKHLLIMIHFGAGIVSENLDQIKKTEIQSLGPLVVMINCMDV